MSLVFSQMASSMNPLEEKLHEITGQAERGAVRELVLDSVWQRVENSGGRRNLERQSWTFLNQEVNLSLPN